MLLDVSGNEGTQRNQTQFLFFYILQHFFNQLAADTFPFEGYGHFGVCKVYLAVLGFYILNFRNVFANVKLVLVSLFVIN